MTNVANDRWLSVEDIADHLGVKRDTIYKWIDRKSMPAHKVSSLWKFQKAEVDAWVRSGHAGGASYRNKHRGISAIRCVSGSRQVT